MKYYSSLGRKGESFRSHPAAKSKREDDKEEEIKIGSGSNHQMATIFN